MSEPTLARKKVTMYKGMDDKYFQQIPFRYWIIESSIMLIMAYQRMFTVWFDEDLGDEWRSYLIGVPILIFLTTIGLPLWPWVVKKVMQHDNKHIGLFFLSSKYVNKKLATFAAITGTQTMDFDFSIESEFERAREAIQD